MAKKKKQKDTNNTIANNRKAFHDYTVLEEWEAGIVLLGTEVKELRKNGANIKDSYVSAEDDEIFLINSYIGEYTQAGKQNHPPYRKRKLLMHRKEINKIVGKLKNQGLTVVPLALYFNDKGVAKIKIGLAKGKKNYDKREVEKTRDWNRQKSRMMKEG
jgi:SsrA-binding protein